MALPNEEVLLRALRDVVPKMSDEATMRDLKRQLCKKLGVPSVTPVKTTIKRLYAQVSSELENTDNDTEHDDNNAASAEPAAAAAAAKQKKRNSSSSTKKDSTAKLSESSTTSSEDASVAALRAMGRAMGLGPRLYKGLKEETPKVQARMLRQRLLQAGAKFNGAHPSKGEIDAAAKKKAAERDLDGIDPSLIVSSKRRRVQLDTTLSNTLSTADKSSDNDSNNDSSDNDDYNTSSSDVEAVSKHSKTKATTKPNKSNTSSTKSGGSGSSMTRVPKQMGVIGRKPKEIVYDKNVIHEEEAEFDG